METMTQAARLQAQIDGAVQGLGNHSPELIERQLKLEGEMREAAVDRAQRIIDAAKQSGQGADLKANRRLTSAFVETLAKKIEETLAHQNAKGGRSMSSLPYLTTLPPTSIAYLTIRGVLDAIHENPLVQQVARVVADTIETEFRAGLLEAADEAAYKAMMAKMLARSRVHTKHAARRIDAGLKHIKQVEAHWPAQEKLHLGMLLIGMVVEATGLIEIRRVKRGVNDTPSCLFPTAETLDWMRSEEGRELLSYPVTWPMLLPPRSWLDEDGGSYLSGKPRLRMVKTHLKGYLEELENLDLDKVKRALDAAARTGWRVQKDVYGVFKEVFERGLDVAGLPNVDLIHFPARPEGLDKDHPEIIRWRMVTARAHEARSAAVGKVRASASVFALATRFLNDTFFYPYQMDFRGRLYPGCPHLSPQGSDLSKALLTFAEGKPIITEGARRWLAIHVANTWGMDKESLDDRVRWTEENTPLIVASAEDPLGNLWWADADKGSKPWQMLAACFEWAGFIKKGWGYVSSIPIGMDATASGIQHFSAMKRDPKGGALVNLVPTPKPSDAYAAVAVVVTRKLEEILLETVDTLPDAVKAKVLARQKAAEEAAEKAAEAADDALEMEPQETKKTGPMTLEEALKERQDMARAWLAFIVKRSTTKRPVMVLPYGGTLSSCRDYVKADVAERLARGEANTFLPYLDLPAPAEDEDPGEAVRRTAVAAWKASGFLAPIVWASIKETVEGARTVMDWLQSAASQAANEGLPIVWTTPDGFVVNQAYPDFSTRRVKTRLCGSLVFITMAENDETALSKSRQRNGIVPNLVHSMDGCQARMGVLRAVDMGVSSFALIHDSFGTVAADCEALGVAMRQAFVDLYTGYCPLKALDKSIREVLSEKLQAKLKEIPEQEDLDLSLVLASPYFIS
jgi:DNA-directed RNA polymerase